MAASSVDGAVGQMRVAPESTGPRIDHRKTDDGVEVICVVTDPEDIKTYDCVLRDHFDREKKLTTFRSTALVIYPIGEFGDIVLDPAMDPATKRTEKNAEGRFIFRQRNTMCNVDVYRQVVSLLQQTGRLSTGLVTP